MKQSSAQFTQLFSHACYPIEHNSLVYLSTINGQISHPTCLLYLARFWLLHVVFVFCNFKASSSLLPVSSLSVAVIYHFITINSFSYSSIFADDMVQLAAGLE